MACRSSEEVFCRYCGTSVANKTYRMHRHLYFDDQTDQWVKKKATDNASKCSAAANYPGLYH